MQDGCDYFCSYCTIPYARGRSRSGKITDLVEQARKVAAEGGKEIVITGVNIGEFGSDTGESFLDLLKAFDAVKGIERYRISSIEPNLLTEEIINWVAKEARAVMPHFHIPLQAGSDAVLKLMHRRYDTALLADRISLRKKLMPDAFIGVDVIAGARGATEEEWRKSLDFINSLGVTRLHVFPYSERHGTKALNIDYIVPMSERHHRVAELTHISDDHLRKFMESHRGKKLPVLWEQPHGNSNTMHGFTDNYIRVEAPYRPEYVNTVTDVILGDILADQPDTMSCEFTDQN